MINYTSIYNDINNFKDKKEIQKELDIRRNIINELYANISHAIAFIESFKDKEYMNIDDRLLLIKILKGE